MKKVAAISVALLLLLSSGCALIGPQDPEKMSPQKLAVWANNVYIDSYDAYMQETKNPDTLSESRKEFLRSKRAILIELRDALDVYNGYLESGTLPRQQITDTVIKLVYKLLEAI
jgi:hypothetical protein